MKKKFKGAGLYIVIVIALIIACSFMLLSGGSEDVKYSQIISYFKNDQVADFTLDFNNNKLSVTLRSGEKLEEYTVPSADLFILTVEDFIKENDENNINNPDYKPMEYNYIRETTVPLILNFVPYLLLMGGGVALLIYMTNKMNGGAGGFMNFGKAKFKSGIDEKRKTTFDDVAGADEEKEELKELVDFLKNPKKYTELGAKIPKGVLLVGPPGTGKTLLARAVAGEAGAPFFSISGSDFVEMYVGVGASRVRDLFDQAKKSSPSIVFIDEIDAVGRQRGAGLGGGHDEREQTLNQLLVEMDGFGANEGVIIIAATNRPDVLDPALLRPGRFDRQVTVGRPDVKGREEILAVHAKGKPLGDDVSLVNIAKITTGFTGADLENLLNEAALLAARRNKRVINQSEIQEAMMKVIIGTEKRSKKVTAKENKLTAYHEAGHAIVCHLLPTQDPVHEVSIIARGMAGGYTLYIPQEDAQYRTKNTMFEDICVALGGRVAEKLILGDISTGASGDLRKATQTARDMVATYGMSDELGPIAYNNDSDQVFLGRDYTHSRAYSEETAAKIDMEIKKVVENAYAKTIELLNSHLNELHAVANALLIREKISGDEFRAVMEGKRIEDAIAGDGEEASSTIASAPENAE